MKQDKQANATRNTVLQAYRDAWHLVLDGELGTSSVTVVIPGHAQERMKQRDIDESEVLQALATHRSAHSRGKAAGRFEAVGSALRSRVRVIYERPSDDMVIVITTYTEPE